MKIERKYYLNKLISHRENGRIKVITGIRRCGKSVLLFDIFCDYLRESGIREDQIITIRLDELPYTRYRSPMELNKYVRGMTVFGVIFFLKTIQLQAFNFSLRFLMRNPL